MLILKIFANLGFYYRIINSFSDKMDLFSRWPFYGLQGGCDEPGCGWCYGANQHLRHIHWWSHTHEHSVHIVIYIALVSWVAALCGFPQIQLLGDIHWWGMLSCFDNWQPVIFIIILLLQILSFLLLKLVKNLVAYRVKIIRSSTVHYMLHCIYTLILVVVYQYHTVYL